MAQKNTPLQLEIFSSSDNEAIRKKNISKSPLNYILTYEKIILLIIGFLVVGIASFSLGVKKGKQLARLKLNKEIELAPKAEVKPAGVKPQVTKEESRVLKEETESQAKPKEEEKANFTIQVATYRTQSYANREAEKLKKKGLKTLVFPKGEYVQLCVGKFLNRDDARLAQKELKQRYQDCFIKRL